MPVVLLCKSGSGKTGPAPSPGCCDIHISPGGTAGWIHAVWLNPYLAAGSQQCSTGSGMSHMNGGEVRASLKSLEYGWINRCQEAFADVISKVGLVIVKLAHCCRVESLRTRSRVRFALSCLVCGHTFMAQHE